MSHKSRSNGFGEVNFPFRLLTVALALSLAACAGWQEKNVVRHGILFDKIRTEQPKDETERPCIIGDLAEDTVIEGFPCARGFIVFHDNWVLSEFRLFRAHQWQGFVMPVNTWVFAGRDGVVNICAFPRDVEIQGHLCRGGRGGKEGVQTGFHPNGSLRSCFSREDVVVNGIPCFGSVFHPIRLHDNGQLQSCTLSRTVMLEGREYLRKSRVAFDRDGSFIGVDEE